MLVVLFSAPNGNGMKGDQDVTNSVKVVKKHKRKMTTKLTIKTFNMKNLILSYFQKANKIVSKRPAIPALGCALIKDGKLTVSNLDVYYSFDVPNKNINCLIDFKILFDIVKTTKGFPVIEALPENKFKVGSLILTGEPIEDFPLDSEEYEDKGFLTKSDIDAIQNVSVFCGKDELRQAMQGVCLNSIEEGEICATNAHVLKTTNIQNTQIKGILHQKGCSLLIEGDVLQTENLSRLKINGECESISFRLIDARYPDYPCVIPKDNPIKIEVNKQDLIKALEIVKPGVNKTTNLVKFYFNGTCKMKAEDIDLGIEAEAEIPYSTENRLDFEIGFSHEFLNLILKQDPSENIRFEMSEPTRAAILNQSSLLMPIMITN